MPHELTMAQMALNATAARRVDDEAKAQYWDERVDLENLRQWRSLQRGLEDVAEGRTARRDDLIDEWDALKGSPEHDGRVNA